MFCASRFSTRTLPWRSNIAPRGARSGISRVWLFSASSRNLSCCRTWMAQKDTTNRKNNTPSPTCIAVRRAFRFVRSSGMIIAVRSVAAPQPAAHQERGNRVRRDHQRDADDRGGEGAGARLPPRHVEAAALDRRVESEKHQLVDGGAD